MNLTIPGLSDVLDATKNMPEQFEALIGRMDTLIELVTETNEILREQNQLTR